MVLEECAWVSVEPALKQSSAQPAALVTKGKGVYDVTLLLLFVTSNDIAGCVGCRALLKHLSVCKAEGPDIGVQTSLLMMIRNPQLQSMQLNGNTLTSPCEPVLPAGDGPAMRLAASSPS